MSRLSKIYSPKRWICILAVVVFALLVPPKDYSAASVTMKYNAEDGAWLGDYTCSSYGSLFMKLTIPYSGLLFVDGSKQDSLSWESARISMVNKKGKRIDRFLKPNEINDTTGLTEAYGVTTGTYYLKMNAVPGRRYWIRARAVVICGDYGGEVKEKAYQLKAGVNRTGVISVAKVRQYRWFKFRLARNARARVTVTGNGGQGNILIYVKGPGLGGTVKKKMEVGAYGIEKRSVTVRKKGWYYVLVTKNADTNDKRSSAQFEIKWKYL